MPHSGEYIHTDKSLIGIVIITCSILLLQCGYFHFFAATGKVGTLFFLALVTFCACLRVLYNRGCVHFSVAHAWAFIAWLLVVTGTLQAFNPPWALLMAGVAGIYLVLFVLLTNVSWTNKPFAETFIDAFLLFGLFAALLGLYEYVHFKFFGSSQQVLIPYLLAPDQDSRVGGPYAQTNLFALFLTLTFLSYCYRYLHRPWTEGRFGSLYLRFLPVLVVTSVFFLTQSRAGTVSMSLILAVLVWLVSTKRYLVNTPVAKKEFFLLMACVGAGFLVGHFLSLPGNMIGEGVVSAGQAKSAYLYTESGTSSAGRFVMWTSAFLIFLDHPWFGAGFDNYRFLMNGYGPSSHDILGFVPYEAMKSSYWVHNELLQLLCEGGLLLFLLTFIFALVFLSKMWRNFVVKRVEQPLFLYSHLFLLPFLIQSQFSWPLRHPALLLLFVTFAAILTAQYPLRSLSLSLLMRTLIATVFFVALAVTGFLYIQERNIVRFRDVFITKPLETTLGEFSVLAANHYSSYRVLRNCLPSYTNAAIASDDDSFALTIIPYYKTLVRLEGNGSQWYDLARLYWRVDRLEDARSAIAQAFELKPTNAVVFEFLHYLNIVKASRETGRPVEDFFPRKTVPEHLNFLEHNHD